MAPSRKSRSSLDRRRGGSPPDAGSAESGIDPAEVRALAERFAASAPGPSGEPASSSNGREEVTLAFATGSAPDGSVHLLPEPVVMATVLCAVEAERAHGMGRLRGGPEVLEAVSPVYWPLPVLRSRVPGFVAIFDGAGVWRREFRYSRLPGLGSVEELFPAELAPLDLVARLRAFLSVLSQGPVPETMVIEGFLPVDPPLLFEVLHQAAFQIEPQSPHAGFLPARHPVDWYEGTVEAMGRSLERFEHDVAELGRLREELRERLDRGLRAVDGERGRLEADLGERSRRAHEELVKDSEAVHHATRQQIRSELDRIRRAHSTISHAQGTASTSEVLASRASRRGLDTSAHHVRARVAGEQEREARRQVRDAQHRIESIHAQERHSLSALVERSAQVDQRAAQELSAHDLFRDELVHAGSDLLDALSAQMATRTADRNALSGYFLPLPALENVQILWFPLWVATFRSHQGIRYRVFPPMRAKVSTGLGSALRTLFGGIVLPLEPRTVHFDSALRGTMESALASDSWFARSMREIVRAADVTADPDFLQRLMAGLVQLRQFEWVTDKQVSRFFEAYAGHVQARLAEGPAPRPTEAGPDAPPGGSSGPSPSP